MPKIIIAIDGHSSTGKSSFAKIIAAKYGLIYVDTGALYRGVTLYAIRKKLIDSCNKIDTEALDKAYDFINLEFRTNACDGRSELYLNGELIEREVRGLEVSGKVSFIAALPHVREFVDKILRMYGERKGVVMDGRDIGTVVFPNAELKIFMTADAGVRAARRYKELIEKGENANYEDVLQNIVQRDFLDENREAAPLRRAEDAIILDNSKMSIDEQIVWFDKIVSQRWN
ncbi:MAG: cytidylate kinase [Bacteroidetes bacterium GWF2_40_14]|nr:MAG: cytidylate kinase [Bacteroidetes bacterium GWF2_40_14]